LALVLSFSIHAAPRRAVAPPNVLAPPPCSEGAIGDGAPQTFLPLSESEVESIVKTAASALNVNTATIAVVDRAGRVQAIFRQPNASTSQSVDDLAVGAARTGAFFSHNMAPLSSRTVRFISGIHFPPGVENTPNAALYGIENTNRGCFLATTFNPNKDVPPSTSISGAPCTTLVKTGCGTGIVTAVNASGIPLYRFSGGKLVGGIGVVGIAGDPQLAEFAAASGAFGAPGIAPVPFFPLPDPGNVFIDGIRLPFLGDHQKLRFNNDGLPIGLQQLRGTQPGNPNGSYVYPVLAPIKGGCADNEYLAGPKAGTSLAQTQVDSIVQRGIAAAKKTRAAIRLPLNSYARMVIAVADLDGSILALYRMPDATVFSIDVAVAKARNVVWFSSDAHDLPGVTPGTAISNRTIGFGAQPLYPPGIEAPPGPFYPLFLKDLANACSQGTQSGNPNQNGIVFFAGSTPLYVNGKLVGGLGVSGDGVEQDDYVTFLGAGEFIPDSKIWADRIAIDKARLPMFKFPRQPEGVTECGGKPCS
jgi:uncharacterized protein GlcG (DUF336 family)